MELSTLFAVLAELAPAGRVNDLDVAPAGAPFAYLDTWAGRPRQTRTIDRLAAVDALHRDERLLRRGWGIVQGRLADSRRVRMPLLVQPVRLRRGALGYRIEDAGDVEVTPLVGDPDVAADLEATCPPDIDSPRWRDKHQWLLRAAEAAGFDATEIVKRSRQLPPHLVIVARAALFLARDVTRPGVADGLRRWARTPDLTRTALAALYAGNPDGSLPGSDLPVRSPLPLDPQQETAVRESRTAAVTVITGPPGCGKSHTLAAIALDAVGRGESVLLATQSVHATNVLREVFDRHAGPTPILFGDAEKREALIAELGAGTTPGHGSRAVRGSVREAESAAQIADRLTDEISRVLELHWRADRASRSDPILFDEFPGLWDVDLAEVTRLFESRRRAGRLRRYLTDRRLRRLLRTTQPVDIAEPLLEPAANHRAAAQLAASEATDLGALWNRLARAEAHAAEALGEILRHRAQAAERRDRVARRAMVELAGALRAGRQRRRQLLAGIDAVSLLRALPLWIGTVGDVEDLLPPTPGMFDLAILDEATHIDQLRAAPVLVRARRTVVSGDPRQLRFVSFVADVDVASVIARHGLADHAAQLDVRRNSAFDVAVGAAPVIRLTEHYRSVPHLIGFSAARFYNHRISTATRHPRNDSVDAIETHVVAPDVADGVNVGEVTAVMRLVDQCLGSFDDVAVITPYRIQADAIEKAILRRYGAEVSGLGLRAGTVHAFQGSEADAVVVSLALSPGDDAGRVRFLEDRRLFNVMITRARHKLHVVTSWPDASPLIKDYFRYADQPPDPPTPNQVGEWTTRLATELRGAGAPVTVGYPVGRWLVDLCIGDDSAALGVFCGVHPDGVGAHLARQRILSRAGWRLADAFAAPYGSDAAVVAVELLGRWRSQSG